MARFGTAAFTAGLTALALLLGAALAGPAAAAVDPAQVRVKTGALTGAVEGQVASFKGVPYARPPFGALRWAPPQSAERWSAPRDATAYGPACPQGPGPKSPLSGAATGPTSEDCLTLNVWTRVGAKGAPVMVWLHGGSNQQGAGSIPYYDGSSFASDGVVLVTVNYRLGPLGFFAHPALTKAAGRTAPLGNYGLMDQMAALRWVTDNIAAFGGDPKRVTVFGESAGGQDILLMLTTPAAKGLFRQAVVESGAGWEQPPTLAEREALGVAAATEAGLPADADAAQLRALPPEALSGPAFLKAFGPMRDGRLITRSVSDAFSSGQAIDVPLIIGSNDGEDSLLPASGQAGVLARVPPEQLAAARAAYPGADDTLLAKNLFRDGVMGAPARWIAGKAAGGAPAWLYEFSYVPAAVRPLLPRAAHGMEVLFVFDTLARSPLPVAALSPADLAFTKNIHGCWVAFAKTGAPTCPDGPAWPRYDAASDPTLVFDTQTAVQPGFRKAAYDLQDAALAARRTALSPQ